MDNKRLFLAMGILLVLLVFYNYLFIPRSEAPPAAPPAGPPIAQQAPALEGQPPLPSPAGPAAPAMPVPQQPAPASTVARQITVDTPLYKAVFSERGGTLIQLTLKKYGKDFKSPDSPRYELLNLPLATSGALALNLPNLDPHLGMRLFTADKSQISLAPGEDPQTLTFTILSGGLLVNRVYTFRADRYDFELQNIIRNQSGYQLEINPELVLALNYGGGESGGMFGTFSYSFVGLEAYKNNSFLEHDKGDMADGTLDTGSISWASINIPYFLGAVIPRDQPTAVRSLRGSAQGAFLNATIVEPPLSLIPDQVATINYTAFYGPRALEELEPLGANLTAAVDFGWFDFIAKPMLWMLNLLYSYVNNYGVAIILVTLLIKIIFFPLAQKSYKSMRSMQAIQPQMMQLRQKYGQDKQRLNQEMMQLYKTYKVNPAGGCLPMLVQIPVFIAFYKVLGTAIELRHADFMLWINDLSAPDRLWLGFEIPWVGGLPVLTLLMGASMFLQQKLTPMAADPTQAKIMLMMPVVFTFMFLNFPSGLVLYWFTNNLLSIAQQWYVLKKQKA